MCESLAAAIGAAIGGVFSLWIAKMTVVHNMKMVKMEMDENSKKEIAPFVLQLKTNYDIIIKIREQVITEYERKKGNVNYQQIIDIIRSSDGLQIKPLIQTWDDSKAQIYLRIETDQYNDLEEIVDIIDNFANKQSSLQRNLSETLAMDEAEKKIKTVFSGGTDANGIKYIKEKAARMEVLFAEIKEIDLFREIMSK